MNKRRVLVGMSGGVDSTATCLMLQEQGYEVLGVTMRTYDSPAKFKQYNKSQPDYVVEARILAKRLGIEHHIADLRKRFQKQIITSFIDEYMKGRTPNPCVLCNPLFKFKMLTEWADRLDCAYISTGHYSRIIPYRDRFYIEMGNDPKKDQSYFLWRLSQDVLTRCIFPLGGLTKIQVRKFLLDKGFEAKAKESESMEVCFIEGDYRDFLREQVPDIDYRIGEGNFVDELGHKLGKHKGFPYYTIGQRKGLEIALGQPAYVLKLNPEKNTVMLGSAEDLKTQYMLVENMMAVNSNEIFGGKDVTVRIRYHGDLIPCEVSKLDDGGELVHFLGEASAVTPGQSAVFYCGKRLLGGAFIASQRGIGAFIK